MTLEDALAIGEFLDSLDAGQLEKLKRLLAVVDDDEDAADMIIEKIEWLLVAIKEKYDAR